MAGLFLSKVERHRDHSKSIRACHPELVEGQTLREMSTGTKTGAITRCLRV
jgi:hypothetical protein